MKHLSGRFALASALIVAAALAPAEYFQHNNLVPSPVYRSRDRAMFSTPGGLFEVEIVQMTLTSGRIPAPPTHIDSFFDVFVDLTVYHPAGTDHFSGNGMGVAHFMPPSNGIYETEMVALQLQGGPILIRESPTRQSLGRTSVQPVQDGYMIDSFFDVFTELSLDGGQNWTPSGNSVRLTGTPEPASLAALALGLGWVARRRVKK